MFIVPHVSLSITVALQDAYLEWGEEISTEWNSLDIIFLAIYIDLGESKFWMLPWNRGIPAQTTWNAVWYLWHRFDVDMFSP